MGRVKPHIKCGECRWYNKDAREINGEKHPCGNTEVMLLVAAWVSTGRTINIGPDNAAPCSEAAPAIIGTCGGCFWSNSPHKNIDDLERVNCTETHRCGIPKDTNGCSPWWPEDADTMAKLFKLIEDQKDV